MGQRTQILVIKENNKGERQAEFYHNQWGYGRSMYLALMDCVIKDYGKDALAEGYDFFKAHGIESGKWRNCTEDVPKDVLKAADHEKFDTIQKVFKYGDNNNGGMVIYVKEDKERYCQSTYKVGFLLGEEDVCDPFSEWVTPQEYGEYNGGSDYSDAEFVDMFDKFCKYFEVEYFVNKE